MNDFFYLAMGQEHTSVPAIYGGTCAWLQ